MFTKLGDIMSGERMIDTHPSGGARPDPHRRLGTRMRSDEAAVVEQRLDLRILPTRRSLDHEGSPVRGTAKRLEGPFRLPTLCPETDPGPRRAEWRLEVERRLPPSKLIGRVHEPPFGLWEPHLVQEPREFNLALHA